MRVTVEIDELSLHELKRLTHLDKISPAISFVVEDWLKQKRCSAFVGMVMEGHSDYGYTNDELESKLYDDAD